METHERFVIRIKHWALDGHAINRIRPVEYNDLYARFFAGAHTEIHRPDERIIARPDILEINEQDIEMFQHFCDWLAVRSEEHTSELQSRLHLVCRLLLEKKKQ